MSLPHPALNFLNTKPKLLPILLRNTVDMDVRVLEFLLLSCPEYIDVKDEEGNSLLHMAVEHGQPEVIEYLLEQPVFANSLINNVTNNAGETCSDLYDKRYTRIVSGLSVEVSEPLRSLAQSQLTDMQVIEGLLQPSKKTANQKVLTLKVRDLKAVTLPSTLPDLAEQINGLVRSLKKLCEPTNAALPSALANLQDGDTQRLEDNIAAEIEGLLERRGIKASSTKKMGIFTCSRQSPLLYRALLAIHNPRQPKNSLLMQIKAENQALEGEGVAPPPYTPSSP